MASTLTIPIKPITKKNSNQIVINHRTGRPMVIPSKQYRRYEELCKPYIPKVGIELPINIKMVFYMDTARKCDLVNLQEACLDVLVKHGLIIDDNYSIVQTMDGSCVMIDRDHPRTEITITMANEVV